MAARPVPQTAGKMKVLQVLPALDAGGVERGTLEIAQALVNDGHTSTVLSAGGRLVGELEKAGSRHVKWDIGKKSLKSPLQARKIRRWLETERFDIVHVRSRMPAWVIWLAWRKIDPGTRPKLVSTVHGLHSVNRYSEIMTCGERVIAVSEAIQQYIETNYPRCDKQKIRLIYRGIDPDAFPYGYQPSATWLNDWFAQYPQTKGRQIVTLPGRLTRLKGHLEFIDLIDQLRRQHPNIIGLVVGGQDPKRQTYAQALYQTVTERELDDYIVFSGHRSDIRDIYAISDVVLSLSSKAESFGRTVLEALSLGRPVVAYDHGGVSEILRKLYPQGAVPLGDQQQLSDRVAAILNSPGSLPQPNDCFLLHAMQKQTLEVYEELLAS